MAKRQQELHIEGKGAAALSLPDIDKLAEVYVKERDKRLTQSPKEIAAKRNLLEAIHAHDGDIPRNDDGHLVYRYDTMKITVVPGKEKLKVEEEKIGEPE